MAAQSSLTDVDWSTLPAPVDDGAGDHLLGTQLASVILPATDGRQIDPAAVAGRVVLFAYPRTGRPEQPLPAEWDALPGARGCTPQSCAFRDLYRELADAGAAAVFGVSTQSPAEQREACERLHLPFPLLSDEKHELCRAWSLPTLTFDGKVLLKRLTLIVGNGRVAKVFYPVFPPDRNAGDVLEWLRANPP
jgi:peroxiredoxin